jgi:hypothetical protein
MLIQEDFTLAAGEERILSAWDHPMVHSTHQKNRSTDIHWPPKSGSW